jgi:hypothetical protein
LGCSERALFFIIILMIVALILILIFVVRIKAVVAADNGNINVSVFLLGIIKLQKKYVIKREPDVVLRLYLITRKGLKPVIALPDIVKKIKETVATDIAFLDLITVILQSLRKKQKNSAFSYIYRKARFNLAVDIKLGIEDAFLTAIVCGILNAASGAAGAVFNNNKHQMRVKVTPEFSKLFFSAHINCIIALTPADIIIGYAIYKKNKKQAVKSYASN